MEPNRQPARRIPWLTIALTILAVVAFFGNARNLNEIMPTSYGVGSATMQQVGGAPAIGGIKIQQNENASSQAVSSMMPAQPYYDPNDSVSDTREFLKTDYNATLRTRDVSGLTRRVETTVRGHEGRIDNTSSSDQYGYVQFVVPLSEFDDFRTEIESFVGSKFISIQISQQNMLPQKQNIEQAQTSVEKNISDLQTARQKLVTVHTNTAASLQAQIGDKQIRLSAIENNTDAASQNEAAQIRSNITSLQSQLSQENASYAHTRDSYDQQIKYANTSLTAVKTQDQDLLDSVATVRGTISLQWISYWEIAHLYLPGNWIPGIIAVLAILAFMYERKIWLFRRIG